jgi:arylsulfatase A-like enzyme
MKSHPKPLAGSPCGAARGTLRRLLAACLLGTTGGLVAQPAAPAQPNIIVILADDLGYADLGCQGSPDVKTPHIDSLAQNGARFTAGYVTVPQCAPSRTALLSGRYQNRLGLESNEQGYTPGLTRDHQVISEYLKDAGYSTGMMGKWGVANTPPLHPPQRGFDETLWNHDGNLYFPDTKSPYDVKLRRGNEVVALTEFSTDAFAGAAIDFIRRHRDRPFFLYLPFINPHEPLEAKPEDLARFAQEKDPTRRTLLALMANLDDNVGRILGALREGNLEENTLVVFLSDNGGCHPNPGNGSRNDPFRGTKSQMLEGGIRVPFLLQWKKQVPAGVVYPHPVSALDVLPTALTAAGVALDPAWKLDGKDLVPYLNGQRTDRPHDTLYWRFQFPLNEPDKHGWAIRQGDWKLVRNGWARTAPALYNLADDPREARDLSAAEPERVQALRAAWEAWDADNLAPGAKREKAKKR